MSNNRNRNRNRNSENRMNVQDKQTRQQLMARLPNVEDGFEPVRIAERTEEERAHDKRVVLFYIGDTAYDMPDRPRVNLAIRYLRDVREVGEEVAQANMMIDLIGEEGFDALCNADDILPEQFEQITNIASAKTLGALENMSKN